MDSPLPANMSTDDRLKAINKLVRGHDSAVKLGNLLHEVPLGDWELISAKNLVVEVQRSFTEALSFLSSGASDGASQNSGTSRVRSPSFYGRREDSGENRKTPAANDGRGGYKRRENLETTGTKITPSPIEDGYSWRKYGQKDILHANYPRCYFRCAHRCDQGCQASKQVQRTQEDPPMYKTTYMGSHTCQDLLMAPQLILDPIPGESILLNFESNVATTEEDYQYLSFFPSIRQEELTEEIQSDPNYLLSPEVRTLGSSGPTAFLSSTAGSDQGEVASGSYPSCVADYGESSRARSIDMDDVMDDSVDDFINPFVDDFDNIFSLDDLL